MDGINLVFLSTDLDKNWFFGGEAANHSVAKIIREITDEEFVGVVALFDKYANEFTEMPQTMIKHLHFKYLKTRGV